MIVPSPTSVRRRNSPSRPRSRARPRSAGSARSCRSASSVASSNASSSVPKPPGITTNAHEYFTSITLRTKKCSNWMKLVEVAVGLLFARQADVAAQAQAAGLACAAIGGFHDARAAARHDGEARSRERAADFARQLVIAVRLGEARGAEDRDAGPVELEALEAVQELEEEAHRALEIGLRDCAGRRGTASRCPRPAAAARLRAFLRACPSRRISRRAAVQCRTADSQ